MLPFARETLEQEYQHLVSEQRMLMSYARRLQVRFREHEQKLKALEQRIAKVNRLGGG